MSVIGDLKSRLKKKPKKMDDEKATPEQLKKGLSWGSTLINLACTGHPDVGMIGGRYYFVVGDSASGKTFLTLTCMAEACKNEHFEDYDLIYDPVEAGADMDFEKFFGKKMATKIKFPAYDRSGNGVWSSTVEEFYFHIDNLLDLGKPIIYVLDSMDALSSEGEGKKFKEQKRFWFRQKYEMRQQHKGKKPLDEGDKESEGESGGPAPKGSYGDGKAKANSAMIRQIRNKLQKTNSILIIICQTRDNVGTFSFEKKTRSGGHALKFYATLEMWSSIREKIKKKVGPDTLQTGIICQLQIKKNRLNGKERKVKVPIMYDIGFDETGSLVQWLLEHKVWKKNGAFVDAKELNLKATEDKLICQIEEHGKEEELRDIVVKAWNEIEDQLKIVRKPRYE